VADSDATGGVCPACGGVAGRWAALRVGDQPVRLNSAALVARMCTACGAIELRGHGSPRGVSPARSALGREVIDGFLRNVWEAIRAVVSALRARGGGEKK
jgi:hypothetical protein